MQNHLVRKNQTNIQTIYHKKRVQFSSITQTQSENKQTNKAQSKHQGQRAIEAVKIVISHEVIIVNLLCFDDHIAF
jgi:hypothetical protein